MPTFLMMCLLTLGCVDDLPIYAAYVPHNQALLKPGDNSPIPPKASDPKKTGTDAKKTVEDPKTTSKDEEPARDVKPDGTSLIDINTASVTELDTLPGIGPAIANRIEAYRKKRKFRRLRDIRRVRGIGGAKFAKLKALITVSPPRDN